MPATPSRVDKTGSGLNWLERWMATKPWETRLMEEFQSDSAEMITPPTSTKYGGSFSSASDHDSTVRIRRNNISTRISPKVPMSCQIMRSSSESVYDESTTSNSNSSTMTSGSTEEKGSKPNYMNLTRSIKAKQRPCTFSSNPHQSLQRHSVEDLPNRRKPSPLSKGNARRSADTDLYSVDLCKDLYPPTHYDGVNARDYYK